MAREWEGDGREWNGREGNGREGKGMKGMEGNEKGNEMMTTI